MSKKTITKNEKLQLEGLLTLAARHQAALNDLKQAACAITGEDLDEYGHTSDAIYSDGCTASELMRKMGITIRK